MQGGTLFEDNASRQRADTKIVAARRKYFAASVSVGALGIAPRELAGPEPWPSGRA